MKTTTKAVVTGATALALVGGGLAYASAAWRIGEDGDRATVVRVVDGDTFVASLDGKETTVRLLNVDTPETKKPEHPVECFGPEASAKLEGLLRRGDTVRMTYDVERRDKYQRTLAAVYKDKTFVNAELAREGLGTAVLFEPNRKHYQEVVDAEAEARKAGRGMFSAEAQQQAADGAACAYPALVAEPARQAEEALAAAESSGAEGAASAERALTGVVAALAAVQAAQRIVDAGGDGARAIMHRADAGASSQRLGGLESKLGGARKGLESTIKADAEASQRVKERQAAEAMAAKQRAEEARAQAEREAEAARKAAAGKAKSKAKEAAEKAKRDAAERAAAKAAAQEKAADRAAADRRAAAKKAAAQAEAKQRAAKAAKQKAQQRAEKKRKKRNHGHGGGSSSNPYPGYTGPRCYAPGGKSWRPC